MFDWARLYVHDGLADVELGLCVKEFHSSRLKSATYAELRDYINNFTVPKSAPSVMHLFSDSAITNNLKKAVFRAQVASL